MASSTIFQKKKYTNKGKGPYWISRPDADVMEFNIVSTENIRGVPVVTIEAFSAQTAVFDDPKTARHVAWLLTHAEREQDADDWSGLARQRQALGRTLAKPRPKLRGKGWQAVARRLLSKAGVWFGLLFNIALVVFGALAIFVIAYVIASMLYDLTVAMG